MLIPGIPGDSTDDKHKDWIEVLSLTQTLESANQKGSSCEIQVVKRLDIAGPRLWAAAVMGQIFGEIKVEVVKSGGDQQQVVYSLKLENARVNSISTAISDTFAESLGLLANTATLSVFTQNPDGSIGPPVTATVSCK